MSNYPNTSTGNGLREIEKNGSDMSQPMEIDFFIALQSGKCGSDIELTVQKYGFVTKVSLDNESGEWTCYCTKSMIPNYEEVVKIEAQLSIIAKQFGGHIDGFGSFGNAP